MSGTENPRYGKGKVAGILKMDADEPQSWVDRTMNGPVEPEIMLTPQALELLEQDELDVTDINVLEAIAVRDGNPLEWERVEAGFEVAARMCHILGVGRISADINAISGREGERQKTLYGNAQREKRELEQRRQLEESTERGMGRTATLLVEALLAPDDPRDRDEIRAQVLRALEPIQDQIDNHYHYPQVIR